MGVLDIKTNYCPSPHYPLQIAAYMELERHGKTEGLTFDQDKHLFRHNGVYLPSVTQVLMAEGFIEGIEWVDPVYLTRGTYVHKATELYDRHDLDESILDNELRSYLEAYKRAKAEIGFKIIDIEVKRYNPLYGYAGIIDRVIEGSTNYVLYLTPEVNSWYKRDIIKTARSDFSVFASAVNTFKWKRSNLKGVK